MSVIPPAYLAMGGDESKHSSPPSASSHLAHAPWASGAHTINGDIRHTHSSHSHTDSHTPLQSSISFASTSTPKQASGMPWVLSEPGGRTHYLPGPNADHGDSDIFGYGDSNASRVSESDALLAHTSTGDYLAVNGHHDGDGFEDPQSPALPSYKPPPLPSVHKKLSQWFATAICGNDITSSCFYVTGLCVDASGVYAPLCMLMVAATLYLFRSIYGEAVTALPLNGGAYNVLLNTTSKSTAAMAACLTILSYMATAVVSAASAIAYLQDIWPSLPTDPAVIILLSFFALLCLWGITESADVALIIFTLHMLTLFTLVTVTVVWLFQNGPVEFSNNWHSPKNKAFPEAIFFGFASAMLGVSGFESSANFVEEQADGVFVKTLRNMWCCVGFFNPVIAVLTLCVYSIDVITFPKENQNITLSLLAVQCGGEVLRVWVCIDAFLVLAGSVLTAYVGVTGLCKRLALDRCLPQFLLAENKWRKSAHWIIIGFLGICSSIYLMIGAGGLTSLAAVYAISFLSVMSLFAIGNMLLKYKRGFLPRSVRASWPTVITALIMVLVALAGVLAQEATILSIWLIYFCGIGFFLACMFFRLPVLRLIYAILRNTSAKLGLGEDTRLLKSLAGQMKGISKQAVAFFVKGGQLSVLNKAILYVRQNEDCGHINIVHVYESESKIPKKLSRNVSILDECYPKVKVDLVLVKGQFGPEMIDYVSQQLEIPKNLCFITSPKEDFMHKLESLGGVRLITH